VILLTVRIEEIGEGSVSSFVSAVVLYNTSENMTETDKHHTEIDSQLLDSYCCGNSVVFYLYRANYGQLGEKVSPFLSSMPSLALLTERRNKSISSLEENVGYRCSGPMADIENDPREHTGRQSPSELDVLMTHHRFDK
jgi:hypothetical protein